MDVAMTECLKWDKPLTSQQAARHHLTRGFVPVELHDAKMRQLAARVRELETENERLRGGLKEIRGMCDGAICYYTATGQHVNVTPTLTLSAAKKLLPITTAALAAKEVQG